MAEIVDGLRDPAAYPFRVDEVEVRQTHISWVFLAGKFAYKVKKPLNLGFLDYSSLERRRFFCHEEVRLNRRLAPDVYLAVVPITLEDGVLQVEGEGEAVEYAVKMVRLSEAGMFDHLLARGKIAPADVQRLAQRIARFHEHANTGATAEPLGGVETIRQNWQENFDQTEPFVGRTLTPDQFRAGRAFVEEELTRNRGLFAARVERGRVRECHGDLRAESIWMGHDGRFEIFDCIEFNERFRFSDVASEVAFLASDLDWRGRPDLAWVWVDEYVKASDDAGLRTVLQFYKCYRAFVRGKVESFVLNQPGFSADEMRAHTDVARQHFGLADVYTARLIPTLILLCGQVGSGKTTLARGVASLLGLPILASDLVRKELAGLAPGEHQPARLDSGLYRPELTRATYQELYRRAERVLRSGQSVILDATFREASERSQAVSQAQSLGAGFFVLNPVVPPELTRKRLAERKLDHLDPSDAGPELFEQTRDRFQPPNEIPADRLAVVDMTRDIGAAAFSAVDALRASVGQEPVLAR